LQPHPFNRPFRVICALGGGGLFYGSKKFVFQIAA
jgi:hypothetical protein